MMRLGLLFSLLFLAACGQNQWANSQHVPPPQRVQDPVSQDAISASRETAITRAVRVAEPAIVSINVIEVREVRDPFAGMFDDFFSQFFGAPRGRQQQVRHTGSGFVISPDGFIVTNDHVAGNATRITVSFPNGATREARLVGTDRPTDLALLKVETDSVLPYLMLAEDPPIVGEWVIALGNPFGLFEAAEPSVTVGVVSALNRNLRAENQGRLYRGMIQTDAAINQGNSGGPLINALGEVIGVNTAIYSPTGGSLGIGFAVPADRARRILDELRENGAVDRAYYDGLDVLDLTPQIARVIETDRESGAFVRSVEPGSPAQDAGIQPHDIIIGISGSTVSNRLDYVARIYDFRPGDTIQITVQRKSRTLTFPLRIGRARS